MAHFDAHPAAQQESALLEEQKEQLHLLSRSCATASNLLGSASGLASGLTSTSSSPAFQGGTEGLAPGVFNWIAAVQVTSLHFKSSRYCRLPRFGRVRVGQKLID